MRGDWPELVGVLNKQLAAIPETERNQITSSWLNFRVEKETDWKSVLLWGLGILVGAGAYYVQDTNKKDYVVVQAPVGAVIPYLPDGNKKEDHSGVQYYVYAGIYYLPKSVNDEIQYEVVSRPRSLGQRSLSWPLMISRSNRLMRFTGRCFLTLCGFLKFA